ncbi:MAG TPA: ABC transporter permease [Patescibacteria group bacterium]|nr:ABC transporter permease [Patescibacteria group bacterium]
MFKSYFIIAFRNLIRHKGFTAINIAGLALGITACLLIGLFVYDEVQYDKFVPDGERIYRVVVERSTPIGNEISPRTPPIYAPVLQQDVPEVETSVRTMEILSKNLLESGDKKLYVENGMYTGANFFTIFPLAFKYGSINDALQERNSIVLSEELATRFFGNENPVGREMTMEKESFLVRGVLKNSDAKFHLKLHYLLPIESAQLPTERMNVWYWSQFNTYVKLKKGASAHAAEATFQQIAKKNVPPVLGEMNHTNTPIFQPLHDIYLHSADFKIDMAQRGNIVYVKALSAIAMFILLIACFNFVNLATAKSLQRAKEVGIRKTLGASRKQLIFQFLGEAVFLTVFSVIISAALVEILLPTLNDFTGKTLTFQAFKNSQIILLLIGLTFTIGILAGLYPAAVLSGFQPVKVLKGTSASDGEPGKTPWLRQGLIVTQFIVSVFLIISAMTVFKQVNFLHNKDLGFSKEQVMFFPMRSENTFKNWETFKNELQRAPGIQSVSIGYGFPGDMVAGDRIIVPAGGERKQHSVTQILTDHDYIKTLGLKLSAGRDFSEEFATDKDHAYIINETAVKQFGFSSPENAIGKLLEWPVWNDRNPDSLKIGQIVGVVKDFHYKSLFDKLEPAVIQIFPEAYWKVAVKLETKNIESAMAHVQKVWNQFSPDFPIEYTFLDKNFEVMYKAEDKLQSLLWIFTGIAIFVACLGLFGLATYSAQRRKKEIGIRKVLGASISNIVIILTKELLRLVIIANIIAWPLAWFMMDGWLQNFAYRISINFDVFLLASAVTVLIAFVTISTQAFKAGSANPVDNLRTE